MDTSGKSFITGGGGETEIVAPLYEKHLEKKGIYSREHRGYKHFHPSAFGGCLRKMAFQYHSETNSKFKIDEPIDVKFMRICDTGHAYHYRMQKDLADMGILRGWWKCKSCGKVLGKEEELGIFLPDICECIKNPKKDKRRKTSLFEYEEVFLESEEQYNFKGNCDGILELDPGDPTTRYVIDFKSISENGFSYLRRPDHKYIVQITIYMWLTGIKKGIIFYEDKNKHQLREFLVPYDKDFVEDIKKTSGKLFKMCKQNKVPKIPKHYNKDNKPCKNFGKKCEFYEFCWGKK